MSILICYLVKHMITQTHRVVWVTYEKELPQKIFFAEQEVYCIAFSSISCNGGVWKTIQHLGKDCAGEFFSELILQGFLAGRKRYDQFLLQQRVVFEFQFFAESPSIDDSFTALESLMSKEELMDMVTEVVQYGADILFELPQEYVQGMCEN